MGFLLDAGGRWPVDDTGEVLDETINIITLLTLREQGRRQDRRARGPVTASRAIDMMAKTRLQRHRTKSSARAYGGGRLERFFLRGRATGGFIFPEFQPSFDGMYAIVKALEMLAKEDARIHKLLREVPPSAIIKDKSPCSFEHKGMIMRLLAEDSGGKNLELIDGIRIRLKDDWVAAYPSQDKAYFHLVAEASTEQDARSLISKYPEKIRKWQV